MNKTYFFLPLMLLAGAASAGDRLTGDALEAFWKDKTIVGEHFKFGPIKTFHGGDGKVRSVAQSGKERNGRWWVDKSSDKKCIEWNQDGKHRCHYLEDNGNGTYTLIHGKNGKSLVQISEVLDGNQL